MKFPAMWKFRIADTKIKHHVAVWKLQKEMLPTENMIWNQLNSALAAKRLVRKPDVA